MFMAASPVPGVRCSSPAYAAVDGLRGHRSPYPDDARPLPGYQPVHAHDARGAGHVVDHDGIDYGIGLRLLGVVRNRGCVRAALIASCRRIVLMVCVWRDFRPVPQLASFRPATLGNDE